mmetsp:Transcript_96707/g.279167  ORF Transcript_96707/g.279167 Transcript_96707/m.279167 type:complete len:437 (+) Transcript_96707:523-1833(+)
MLALFAPVLRKTVELLLQLLVLRLRCSHDALRQEAGVSTLCTFTVELTNSARKKGRHQHRHPRRKRSTWLQGAEGRRLRRRRRGKRLRRSGGRRVDLAGLRPERLQTATIEKRRRRLRLKHCRRRGLDLDERGGHPLPIQGPSCGGQPRRPHNGLEPTKPRTPLRIALGRRRARGLRRRGRRPLDRAEDAARPATVGTAGARSAGDFVLLLLVLRGLLQPLQRRARRWALRRKRLRKLRGFRRGRRGQPGERGSRRCLLCGSGRGWRGLLRSRRHSRRRYRLRFGRLGRCGLLHRGRSRSRLRCVSAAAEAETGSCPHRPARRRLRLRGSHCKRRAAEDRPRWRQSARRRRGRGRLALKRCGRRWKRRGRGDGGHGCGRSSNATSAVHLASVFALRAGLRLPPWRQIVIVVIVVLRQRHCEGSTVIFDSRRCGCCR